MDMRVDRSLPRLMQLVSPSLPIGMYSYSQGLEKAVEDGWITDEAAVFEWLSGLLERYLATTDAAVLARLYDAWRAWDLSAVSAWSRHLLAFRETAELRLEDRQTGQALARLLAALEVPGADMWVRHPCTCLATVFSLAGVSWNIPKADLIAGYLWSWLENQVLCAVKLVPLGQASGQRLLSRISEAIPAAVESALALEDKEIGGSSPALAIVSARHESQYSRLFRS